MEFITINNTRYDILFTHRVLKVVAKYTPSGNPTLGGGLDMVEHVAVAAMNAAYKRDKSELRIDYEGFLDLLDEDPYAFTKISEIVSKGIVAYNSGKEDKPKKGAKK